MHIQININFKMKRFVLSKLNYQKIIPGKSIGRYIGQPDKGDIADEHSSVETKIHNARDMVPPAHLESVGFQLWKNPTKVKDFMDDEEIKTKYYPEIESLVKRATGASDVFLFDHTVRKSSVKNLNNLGANSAAGSVLRVHCDYTEDSAPRRFLQMG